MIFKALTILLLVAAVLGGSAYFVYDLYYKDKKLDIIEQMAPPTPVPSPTPDQSVAAWDALKPTAAMDTIDARESIKNFITTFPDSVRLPEATAALGRINLAFTGHAVSDLGFEFALGCSPCESERYDRIFLKKFPMVQDGESGFVSVQDGGGIERGDKE